MSDIVSTDTDFDWSVYDEPLKAAFNQMIKNFKKTHVCIPRNEIDETDISNLAKYKKERADNRYPEITISYSEYCVYVAAAELLLNAMKEGE